MNPDHRGVDNTHLTPTQPSELIMVIDKAVREAKERKNLALGRVGAGPILRSDRTDAVSLKTHPIEWAEHNECEIQAIGGLMDENPRRPFEVEWDWFAH